MDIATKWNLPSRHQLLWGCRGGPQREFPVADDSSVTVSSTAEWAVRVGVRSARDEEPVVPAARRAILLQVVSVPEVWVGTGMKN